VRSAGHCRESADRLTLAPTLQRVDSVGYLLAFNHLHRASPWRSTAPRIPPKNFGYAVIESPPESNAMGLSDQKDDTSINR
jgi:hypothetical protein